nr:right-handed parallel beta-helix repeat-containing protein [Pseudopontixanthobacter vadosimaris]
MFFASPASAAQLDIREFGARANDGNDDSAALKRALRQAQSGDSVRIPSGTFEIAQPVRMPSGVTLAGEGCGRSVLRRQGQKSGQIMFLFDGADDVAVRGIEFDYAAAPEYYRAIGFRGRGSSAITIADNCFIERDFQGGRGDRWAVELSATQSPSRNITVTNNEVRGNMQLTAGGGAGLLGATIRDNRIVGARANGIAISTLSHTARFSDVTIADNIIETSSAIGIFIGPDQPQAGGGRFENIRIIGNRVSGLRNRFAYGIFIRAPADGMTGVTIADNALDGRGSAKAIAIRFLDDHGRGTRRFSDVRICGNSAANFSRGIWLQRVFGGVVAGNRLITDRPFEAAADQNGNLRTSGACRPGE